MWRLPIRCLLSVVVLFATLRLAMLFIYPDYFAGASFFQAWLSGVRFDLKLGVLAFAPCLLWWLLPIRKGRVETAWLAWAIWAILLGLGIADIAYFGEVNRHIGGDLFNVGGDLGFLFQTAFSSRLAYTLAGLGILVASVWIWKKWLLSTVALALTKNRVVNGLSIVLLLVLYVFLARGMVLSGRPLNSIDAFNNTEQNQANLALNGVLLSFQALKERQSEQPLNYLDSQTEQTLSARYPQAFYYQPQANASGKKKNIVFILLESWSFKYIDSLSGSHYGVTPNMDKLVAQSQVWTKFYAAGQRSIIGIQAALTSVPALPHRKPLGFGLELNQMSRIAHLAGKQGYRTLMGQSSNRRSFHMDGIAKSLGFQEYFGKEDIPLLRSYPQDTPAFGWDYDSLMFLGKKISEGKQPFFAFFFSGTTHEPFARVGKEFEVYPHDEAGENGFLNTLKYSDWAVGEFMAYARKQAWYQDTIFVFTADHTLNGKTESKDLGEKFHIPLIVFSEQWQPAVHQNISSQYDLLPTFADWLGVAEPVYTFGRSLANSSAPGLPLMLNYGDNAVLLSEKGTLAFSDGINQAKQPVLQDDLQQLQWRMQKADALLRANRWAD